MDAIRITNKITNRQSDAFKRYLNEISKIKRFATPEHEAECALRASMGDKAAFNELVERNLRFVVSVAKQYEVTDIALVDLVNEGNIGLIMAVEKYNPDTGFKFISYAVFYIRKWIREYLTNNGRPIRLPANKINSISKFKKKQMSLEQENGTFVDDFQVLEALAETEELSEKELSDLGKIMSMDINSLDGEVSPEESTTCLYEIIADENVQGSDHITNNSDAKIEVEILLKQLKPRDRLVMKMLFGLEGEAQMSLEKVGEKVGLTREMVRQIKKKSLNKLKNIYKD
jgi:RNA polymerase primary sigma factor